MPERGDIQYLAEWNETPDLYRHTCKEYKRLAPAIVKARNADLNNEGKVYEQRWDGREWEDIRVHTVYGESYSPYMFE